MSKTSLFATAVIDTEWQGTVLAFEGWAVIAGDAETPLHNVLVAGQASGHADMMAQLRAQVLRFKGLTEADVLECRVVEADVHTFSKLLKLEA